MPDILLEFDDFVLLLYKSKVNQSTLRAVNACKRPF